MSKILTLPKAKDVPVIYNFVKLLAKTHGKDGVAFQMSERRFTEAFNKNFFHVNVVKENEHEICGIMLHMKEFSLAFKGYGSYLDDFYIDDTLRGKGMGRKMISELCENLLNDNQKYLKVIFQKNLDLDNFYNHFGFINYSDRFALNLYEGNNSDLENILAAEDNNSNELNLHKISSTDEFPIYEITVKRMKYSYTFCCQFYFNSWSSFGILMSDFTGDTVIVRLSDFKMGIRQLLKDVGWSKQVIRSLWWYAFENQTELGCCIESCFAENIHEEGWKVSFLDEKGMKILANVPDNE